MHQQLIIPESMWERYERMYRLNSSQLGMILSSSPGVDIFHTSLNLIFAQFHFHTDILVEETAKELELNARAVMELDFYSPGSSSLLTYYSSYEA
jgi:hypothetical protein